MALTTKTMTESKLDKDNTPEYEVKLDSEGKGYLAKKEVKVEEPVEEIKVEEPVEEVKKSKAKRRYKK